MLQVQSLLIPFIVLIFTCIPKQVISLPEEKDILVTIPQTDVSVPLFAAKDSHHVHIYVGSPPQRRIVIVDTGSRLLVFPCDPCTNCGKNHISGNFFDPDMSSTDLTNNCDQCDFHNFKKNFQQCKDNKCLFHQSYTEGSSMDGFEMEDITWLGTENVEQSVKMYMHMAVPMTFGCQTSEKGLIATQFADGIMGLSHKMDNIISKMYKEGSILHHAFSLCLTRKGGIMSIGGTSSLLYRNSEGVEEQDAFPGIVNKPVHLEEMKTVPISTGYGYYSIRIVDFHVGDYSIQSPEKISSIFNKGKGTIIDSGTTDMYLPERVAIDFRKVWMKINGKVHSNQKSSLTYMEYQRLPNVTFTLENGYHWTVLPDQYMEEENYSQSWDGNESKQFFNRIYLDESTGAVLGANAMFNHDILFDLTNNRICIAAAICSG